jgi:hypothetical protein
MSLFSTSGSVSTEMPNERFTGLFLAGIGLLAFKLCLMVGLMRGIMTSEIPLNRKFELSVTS